jgi:hypothetical protein
VSAAEALQAARAAGIQLRIDGDGIVLKASAPPPAPVLNLLSRHKADVVRMLRSDEDSWSALDSQVFFDERAGIAEFDGGLPRPQAEAHAFACCVAEWLNHHPVDSGPGRCVGCGGTDRAYDPLLPYGIEHTGHAWLHTLCWSPWYADRKAQAIAALATMGIAART